MRQICPQIGPLKYAPNCLYFRFFIVLVFKLLSKLLVFLDCNIIHTLLVNLSQALKMNYHINQLINTDYVVTLKIDNKSRFILILKLTTLKMNINLLCYALVRWRHPMRIRKPLNKTI